MKASEMSRKEFESMPYRKWDEETKCRSLVLLPLRSLHESGYRNIDLICIDKDDAPICKVGSGDVIHIEGIGGLGYGWLEKYNTCPKMVKPHAFNIDCLPKSGLFRLFGPKVIIVGNSLSSLEIYGDD